MDYRRHIMAVFPHAVRLALLSLTLAALPVACGDDDDATDGSADDTSGDTAGDTASPDAGGDASTGALTLDGTWNSPPAVGPAALTVTVTDANGAPVTDATVTAFADMPSMGHGTPSKPAVTAKGNGLYEVRFTFNMPGYWEVDITATAGERTGTLKMKATL
jgi:hypothetical protein